MKSAFGAKRKARKIQVDEEEDGGANDTTGSNLSVSSSSSTTTNPPRKAFKKSSLRQSVNAEDLHEDGDGPTLSSRPSISRSGSVAKKRKPATSRLSFGPGEIISGDAAEALEEENFTPVKKGLGRRIVEKSTSPTREEDNVRPMYSKDYLNELKSSTPNARPTETVDVEDDLGLDELDGAMIVNMETRAAYIPSEAEIKEKKERRARLAHEEDFISLNDDGGGSGDLQLSLSRKKKPTTRLVREDEDLGEGFDEFVDDGRIALGKKQERAARRQQRKEMAAMILDAEASSDEESDDSEAERRAAYEVAQTRAGMDGLHKAAVVEEEAMNQIPSKITPLPNLVESIKAFQITLAEMESDMAQRQSNLAELEQERSEILAREIEVQELLKQAGQRYSALQPNSSKSAMNDAQEVLDAHENEFSNRMADRGLESFGNTPITIRPAFDDP